MELVSDSPEHTQRLAARVAPRLAVGDVVTVEGELGTGKTTWVRGACEALGVRDRVTSPTFTVGHRYEGRVPVSHLDLYRFTGVSTAEWGELEPYFEGAVVFVEWPEAAGASLPSPRLSVRLSHRGESTRGVELDAADAGVLQGLSGAC